MWGLTTGLAGAGGRQRQRQGALTSVTSEENWQHPNKADGSLDQRKTDKEVRT